MKTCPGWHRSPRNRSSHGRSLSGKQRSRACALGLWRGNYWTRSCAFHLGQHVRHHGKQAKTHTPIKMWLNRFTTKTKCKKETVGKEFVSFQPLPWALADQHCKGIGPMEEAECHKDFLTNQVHQRPALQNKLGINIIHFNTLQSILLLFWSGSK